MAGLIRYLLLANLFLISLALFYRLVLSRETRFNANRFILLLGTVMSLVLPLSRFNWFPASSYSILTIPEIIVMAKSGITHIDLNEILIFGTAPFTFPWIKLIALTYFAGAMVTGLILIWKIKKLQYWTRQFPMKWFRNLYITLMPDNWSPFSFLGIVYFPVPFNKEDKRAQMILEHERVHIRQKHGWDILFIEAVKVIFFYNPAIYTIMKQIQINHEFIADSAVEGEERKFYSQELIRSQLHVPQFQFIQQFNHTSFLKRRILMLMKNRSNSYGIVKYLMLLPLIGGLLWFSACTDQAEPKINTQQIEKTSVNINIVKSKSIVETYADAIIQSDYSEMNKWEKQAKAVAIEMQKSGASEEEVLTFVKGRILFWANQTIAAIETSEIFKSSGLEIEDIEFDPLEMETDPGLQKDLENEVEGEVFFIVENMPEFVGGGLEEFSNWVNQNVKYPQIAIQNGISGTVYVDFVIDKTGSVSSVKIAKGVDPSLDNEVTRVLKTSPAWTPGKQRGKLVNVKMSIPVKFMLQ